MPVEHRMVSLLPLITVKLFTNLSKLNGNYKQSSTICAEKDTNGLAMHCNMLGQDVKDKLCS